MRQAASLCTHCMPVPPSMLSFGCFLTAFLVSFCTRFGDGPKVPGVITTAQPRLCYILGVKTQRSCGWGSSKMRQSNVVHLSATSCGGVLTKGRVTRPESRTFKANYTNFRLAQIQRTFLITSCSVGMFLNFTPGISPIQCQEQGVVAC